jgi:hypothetical protein
MKALPRGAFFVGGYQWSYGVWVMDYGLEVALGVRRWGL